MKNLARRIDRLEARRRRSLPPDLILVIGGMNRILLALGPGGRTDFCGFGVPFDELPDADAWTRENGRARWPDSAISPPCADRKSP